MNSRDQLTQDQLSRIVVVKQVAAQDVLDTFPDRYQILSNDVAKDSWQLLDTFDQELKNAGQILLRRHNQIILVQPDTGIFLQDKCPKRWSFVSELKTGAVSQYLQGVDPLRACLPLVDLDVSWQHHRFLDDQQKTICRLDWLTLKLKNQQVSIIHLKGVRGYKKAFKSFTAALNQHSGGADHGFGMIWEVLCTGQHVAPKKQNFLIDPHERAAQVKTDLIGFYLAHARASEQGVVADWDTEFLHDYRVSLRKVRSVLSLFKGVFSEDVTRALKTEFSNVMRSTNDLRDLDVYLLDKQDYLALVPEPMRPGLEKMFTGFASERRKQLKKVRAQLESSDYQQEMQRLQQQFPEYNGTRLAPSIATPLGPLAEEPVGEYASKLIYKRYRKIRKMARVINDGTSDQEVHELRIEFKKLRYLMEFFATLYPPLELKELLKSMKSLQSSLGRFNDYSVQQISLNIVVEMQQQGKRKADMDIVRSIGALVAAIHAKQLEARRQIALSLDGFTGDKMASMFTRLFHASTESKTNEDQSSGKVGDASGTGEIKAAKADGSSSNPVDPSSKPAANSPAAGNAHSTAAAKTPAPQPKSRASAKANKEATPSSDEVAATSAVDPTATEPVVEARAGTETKPKENTSEGTTSNPGKKSTSLVKISVSAALHSSNEDSF